MQKTTRKTKHMNLKSTIAATILLIAPLCTHGQTAWTSTSRRGDALPTGPQIEMKMKQIELDVAMKQFEKIQTSLAEARVELRLLDESLLGEEAYKEQMARAERKMERLAKLNVELEQEIHRHVSIIEEYRKKYSITEAMPYTADPMVGGPRPAPTQFFPPPTSPPKPAAALPGPKIIDEKPVPTGTAFERQITPVPAAVPPANPSTPVSR